MSFVSFFQSVTRYWMNSPGFCETDAGSLGCWWFLCESWYFLGKCILFDSYWFLLIYVLIQSMFFEKELVQLEKDCTSMSTPSLTPCWLLAYLFWNIDESTSVFFLRILGVFLDNNQLLHVFSPRLHSISSMNFAVCFVGPDVLGVATGRAVDHFKVHHCRGVTARSLGWFQWSLSRWVGWT